MRARYYSPEMRRFINADIIAGAIYEAITLNRYAYANGNPVSNVDPFGLTSERCVDLDEDGFVDLIVYSYNYKYTKYIMSYSVYNSIYSYNISTAIPVEVEGVGNIYFFLNGRNNSLTYKEASAYDYYIDGFDFSSDLIIVDYTMNSNNPEFVAYQAHKLNNENREYVVEIMKEYDEKFDTGWNRTKESLLTEWVGHDMFSIASSAQDINFDNKEEGKDLIYFVNKAIDRAYKAVVNKIKSFF